ncbi:hypothetical protein [Draconibacterium mangrovi]|uniref:hypothetical protein n=1 Tax=Draconibacterium mangrovi TaxID=2697469 RepID=UPI0013D7D717|nr:hypothetical protein [Draconibacterium mangrovi]
MEPPKQSLPKIVREVKLKEVLCKKKVTKAEIYALFKETENSVLYELLTVLLGRESISKDIELIELEEYEGKETGNYVYYCGVKIGRLLLGGPGNMLMSIISMKDVFYSFYPDEKYVNKIDK